jgi:hypothetical protein
VSSEQIADNWLSFALSLWIYSPSNTHDPIDGDVVNREYALSLLLEKTLTECQIEEDQQQSRYHPGRTSPDEP